MYEKLKDTLRTISMLYVIEDKTKNDYHLMPFRLTCDNIIISDLENAWENYMATKPSVILIHVMTDDNSVIKLVKDIRKIHKKCSIIILTSQNTQHKLQTTLDKDIQKILIHPVDFEDLILSLEDSIDYRNLYFYINENIMLEPNINSLIIDDEHIELTPKENNLLILLLKNRHRIVSYFEIDEYVWIEKNMSRNTLTSIVKNIRNKARNNNIIKNHSGEGYQIGK